MQKPWPLRKPETEASDCGCTQAFHCSTHLGAAARAIFVGQKTKVNGIGRGAARQGTKGMHPKHGNKANR